MSRMTTPKFNRAKIVLELHHERPCWGDFLNFWLVALESALVGPGVIWPQTQAQAHMHVNMQ